MGAEKAGNLRNIFILGSAFLLLSGCEVNGSKRETRVQDSIIVSLTTSTQYATKSAKYQSLFPLVTSFSAAADSASSMELYVSPPEGCYNTAALEQTAWEQVMRQRYFDVGKVQIRTLSGESAELNRRDDNLYYRFVSLPSGKTRLSSEGVRNGSLKMKTDFDVLSRDADIAVFEVDEKGEGLARYDMVTPEIPTEADRIVLKKNGFNLVAYNAPEGTDFVKVTIDDGRNSSEGSMTCISQPDRVTLLPPEGLKLMVSTTQASLRVEFISVAEITDVSRLKLGHVISSMAHIQGTIVYKEDGETQTDAFGVVEIR